MNSNEEKNETVAETTPSTETTKTDSTPKAAKKTPAKKTAKSAVAKKVTAKKVEAKKTPAKKATVKPAAKTPSKKVVKPAAKTPAKKAVKAPVKKSPAKKGKAEKRSADNFNRNFGRIKVGTEVLSKGRAVHAVVVAFADKKKPTLAQLKTAFGDDLLKNYGIIQEIGKAKKYSMNGKNRFFVGKEDLITTRDGKTVAVCNQFSTENIKPFIKHAKTLGFSMTPAVAK